MARGWFYNIPYHGHINPTLPLVEELVRRGDEISYFTTSNFEQKVSAVGANFRPYSQADVFDRSRTESHTAHVAGLVAEATHALLPEVLLSVQNEKPDYLMFDMSAPWGSIASRKLNVLGIGSFPHFPFYWRTTFNDRRVFRRMLKSIRPGFGYWGGLARQTWRIVKDFNLRKFADINVLSSSAATNIVFTSRFFQPFESHFDDSYYFVGPVINTDRSEDPLMLPPSLNRELIYIAVGTQYEASIGFFQECFRALGESQHLVVLSVGRAVEPALLGPAPENFTVVQFAPQLSILAEADLFITHGGMNSIAEAIHLAVPMIVVPNTLEQAINAARLEQLQAGLYLDPTNLNSSKIRTAVETIMSDPYKTRGVELIQDSFQEAGGIQRAADVIQKAVGQPPSGN